MKWIFISIIIILLVSLLVSFVLLQRIDSNDFKGYIEEYLAEHTGLDIQFEKISIAWGILLKIQADKITVLNPQGSGGIFFCDNVDASIDLLSLLRRQFFISHISLKNPKIHIALEKDGGWNWDVKPKPDKISPKKTVTSDKASDSKKEAKKKSKWSVGVGKINISNCDFSFIDRSQEPDFSLNLKELSGEVRIRRLRGLVNADLSAKLPDYNNGAVKFRGVYSILKDSVEIELGFNDGKMLINGILTDLRKSPQFDGSLAINGLNLEEVLPDSVKRGEYISGKLTANIKGSFQGFNPVEIKRSLSLNGKATILNGALKNRNLIRDIFSRLSSVIPVNQILEGDDRPPELRELVENNDMPFSKASLHLRISNAQAYIDSFKIEHKDYTLESQGEGRYDLVQELVYFKAYFALSEVLSAHFVKKVKELGVLLNSNGLLIIPFICKGNISRVMILPDLHYIAAELLRTQTRELLNQGIKKLTELWD